MEWDEKAAKSIFKISKQILLMMEGRWNGRVLR